MKLLNGMALGWSYENTSREVIGAVQQFSKFCLCLSTSFSQRRVGGWQQGKSIGSSMRECCAIITTMTSGTRCYFFLFLSTRYILTISGGQSRRDTDISSQLDIQTHHFVRHTYYVVLIEGQLRNKTINWPAAGGNAPPLSAPALTFFFLIVAGQ